MPYTIQLDTDVAAGNVFAVGDAGVSSTDALGEAASADHTSTKPSLLLINPAGSGYDCYLLNLSLTQSGTVAGGRPEVMLGYDAGNRFSSGGAAKTPVNKKAGGRTSSMACYQAQSASLITATAASASVRYFMQREFHYTVTGLNDVVAQVFDLCGSVVIPAGWSFLFYCRAATTGLTFHWNIDFLEKAA